MFKLRVFLKPYWIPAILAPLCMILEVYMDVLQPKYMATIVNQGVVQRNVHQIEVTGLIMVGIMLIGLLAGVGCNVFASIIMALTLSLRLGVILIVSIPILAVFLYLLIRLSYPLFAAVQRNLDGVNTVVQENLAGIRVVKAFVRSRHETDRRSELSRTLYRIFII